MNHIYQNIDGWFDWEDIYSDAVRRFPAGSEFLEIGVYKGKSASYLMTEVFNSGKKINLSFLDSWDFNGNGCISNKQTYIEFSEKVMPLVKIMWANKFKVDIIMADASVYHNEVDPHFFDFIFIDGGHDYMVIKNDIINWLPKVKIGGIIAGHDYSDLWSKDVVRAVKESFPDFRVSNNSWIVQL